MASSKFENLKSRLEKNNNKNTYMSQRAQEQMQRKSELPLMGAQDNSISSVPMHSEQQQKSTRSQKTDMNQFKMFNNGETGSNRVNTVDLLSEKAMQKKNSGNAGDQPVINNGSLRSMPKMPRSLLPANVEVTTGADTFEKRLQNQREMKDARVEDYMGSK